MGIVTIERSGVFKSSAAGPVQIGWHLYLVYKSAVDAPIDTWQVIRATRKDVDVSPDIEDMRLDIQNGLLIDTADNYAQGETSASRGARILATGSAGDSLWAALTSAANNITDLYHSYNTTDIDFDENYILNSNSYIANVLNATNINVFDVMPSNLELR